MGFIKFFFIDIEFYNKMMMKRTKVMNKVIVQKIFIGFIYYDVIVKYFGNSNRFKNIINKFNE